MLFELWLLLTTNIIVALVILVVMFATTVPRRLRVTLILTIGSLAAWQDTVYISNNTHEAVEFWNNLAFVWPGLAIISFFIFVHQLGTHKKWLPGNRLHTVVKYFPNVVLTVGLTLQLLALFSNQIYVQGDQADVFVRGSQYITYIVGLLMSLAAVVSYVFLNTLIVRKNSRDHRAIQTVFDTLIIAVLFGLTFNVILPLMTSSQMYAEFGSLTVVIFAIGFTMSVMRGQLLDIKLYAVRTVVYLLSILSLALIYALIAYSISQWILDYTSTATQGLINMALALLLAFIFQPIKRFFDRLTNHFFYQDYYSRGDFFARFSSLLTSTTDLRGLLERAATEISNTLHSEFGFFVVYDDDGHYVSAGTGKHDHFSTSDMHKINEYLRTNGDHAVITELFDDDSSFQSRLLNQHDVAVTLPLFRAPGEIIGFFALGTHKSGRYSKRDIHTIETISDELVIAIQNALSVQEIKELNATLEHRIDEATKELRESNAQLQHLDATKDEFISMASHQLRTPLTSVKGYISMVIEGDVGKISGAQKQLLSEAFTSSERMVHLINDFLNVSRLQTGKFMIDRREIDLAKLVEQELDSLQTTARSHDLKLRYRRPSHIPLLYLDEGKLRQVIMNFVDNAIYYSRENSTISVGLSVENGDVVFVVKDTGIGVPLGEQKHLFGKFFRATNARTQRPDGTGVGLFLAKKVIIAHGGSMIFDSVEGQGSTFGFRLPVKKLSEPPLENAQ
ncbi:MAG: HAMP domain-containing sensor histidine kinase [Candidatus Saccharimonadales bacterium]